MTQEEKAKAYDEALSQARFYYGNCPTEPEKKKLEKLFPELRESEDERIMKRLITLIHILDSQFFTGDNPSKEQCLAYLENQKDILGERAQNITANMLEDGIEGVQRELIEFLSNTVNASWVDIIRSADSYAERIRNIIEKQKGSELLNNDEYHTVKVEILDRLYAHEKELEQLKKEQKPAECIEFDNEFKNQVSHLLASVLNKEWEYNKGFVEYAAQQLLGYAKHEIKPAEWSEEDTHKTERLLYLIASNKGFNREHRDEAIGIIKSLRNRPTKSDTWKPSEEQMEALANALSLAKSCGEESSFDLRTLYEQLKRL